MITFGHGTASIEELAGLIRDAGIQRVVDVRAFPKSRRHPHVWREEMETWVPALAGSAYRWDAALGGFRPKHADSPNVALRHPSFRAYADHMETAPFAIALRGLLEEAADARVAVMCSETLWWRCHRRLISDAALLLHGEPVEHLMHDGTLRPHIATAGVRVTEDGGLRYDAIASDERDAEEGRG